jgi:hypothetical protein
MSYRLSLVIFALAMWVLLGIQPMKIEPFSLSIWASAKRVTVTIDSMQLKEAIHLSANYLINRCNDNGKFLYRINLNTNIRPKPKYNLLRHAGTIYALTTYDQHYPGKITQNALDRAVGFLKESSIAPLSTRKDLLAVWSHPEITGSNKPVQAKLGGTGIGLLALLSVEKRRPGTTPVEYLRKMGNFLLFMQKTDGSFFSKYIPGKGGKDDSWISLYYPGEAALGLLMLYEKDPSVAWLQAAATASPI